MTVSVAKHPLVLGGVAKPRTWMIFPPPGPVTLIVLASTTSATRYVFGAVDEDVVGLGVCSTRTAAAAGGSCCGCGVLPKTAPSTKRTEKAERTIIIQRGIRFSREGRSVGSVCMGVLGILASGGLCRFLSFIHRMSLQARIFRHEAATNRSPSAFGRYAGDGVAIHR
ncbi:hypothetical protein [Amycolatopsis sp. lyj-84]|uniref:hypothetical protein n=1 Tax=Amycolatopsis sp. lyj-84 TaxID=2789284 RepID=UPI00397AC897